MSNLLAGRILKRYPSLEVPMPVGKRVFSVWIDYDVADKFAEVAVSRGETLSGLLRTLIHQELNLEPPRTKVEQDPYFERIQAWSYQPHSIQRRGLTIDFIAAQTIGPLRTIDDRRRVGVIMAYLGWRRGKGGWHQRPVVPQK
jgi:hypothetical protein